MEINQAQKWLEVTKTISKFSKAKRRKVGALIISKSGIILATGYNGTPRGTNNTCEDINDVTHEYVIHAELNAIFNSSVNDLSESTMIITDSPCLKCASAILQKGIKEVFYDIPYRLDDGIKFLELNGVKVTKISSNEKIFE